jgi:predicted phosphodiesterase
MKVRVLSDLHLEFFPKGTFYKVEQSSDEDNTVLVLAGDITTAFNADVMKYNFVPFINDCCSRFARVIMVCGNHEHYTGDMAFTNAVLKGYTHHLTNFVLLDKSHMEYNNVVFVGATLWTDCGRTNPKAEYLWHGMNDSKIIVRNGKIFRVALVKEEHYNDKKYLISATEKWKKAGKEVVWVCHHGPSHKSVHPMYRTGASADMNMFYVSNMDLDIASANPKFVIHGHTHQACRYKLDETICDTEVVCNPHGYNGCESSPESRGFDPLLTIEV